MARLRSMRALAAATLALAGCATTPEPEPPPPAAPAPVAPQVCPVCVDQAQEVARLRQDLASREAEIRELRSSQRDQVKVIQESTREVTRAKAKMRRLATQADAASYIAEVEVALGALRASLPASPPAPPAPLVALAQSLLDSTAAPFAQGDYGAAMDRAAQAEQLIAVAADGQRPPSLRVRVPGEVLLQVAIPLRLAADGTLRREPQPLSTAVAKLAKDTPLVAHAYRGSWMRVETPDGRSGWVAQAQLEAR